MKPNVIEGVQLFRYIALSVILILLNGCATEKVTGKTEAEKLFKEAEIMMKNGRYIQATEKLSVIKGKYPYSYYATFAELKLADILFFQKNYAEAAAAYIVFKDFHPKHNKIDYVIAQIGESFYKQIPSTFDRDLSPAFESIRYYQFLLRSFPASEYTKQAQEKIAECEEMIRNKEKYIADFYYKTEVYKAARHRYQNIIKNFSEPELIDHSVIRSLRSSISIKDRSFCLKNKNILKQRVSKDSLEDYTYYLNKCLAIKEVKGDDVEKL